MEKVDKKKILMYVFTQLKKGNFKHWDDDVLELDSPTVEDYIDMDETIVKKYINILIGLTTSEYFNNNISFENYMNLCQNSVLEESILMCVKGNFWDEDGYGDKFRWEIMCNVFEILLYSIFEYVNEYHKLSQLEIDSFLLFGKNFFKEIQPIK